MKIEINKIRLDGGTQFRKTLHQDKIYQYKEAMEEGAIFPKIKAKFDGMNYWLYSGFHRYHAMKLLNFKEIEIVAESGAKSDAVLAALGENSDHGIPLTNSEKRKKVKAALALEAYADASNYEIAKLCRVSKSFVGAVRNPEVKEKQKKNWEKSAAKKLNGSSTTNTKSDNLSEDDMAPSEEELTAQKYRQEQDEKFLAELLDSNDKLATLYEENKKLSEELAVARSRIKSLTNEKKAAIDEVKRLRKQIDKLSKD